MITKKGWEQALMFSLFRQESAASAAKYGEAVTMNDANACSMKSFEFNPEWADEPVTDRDEVSGTEHGTVQEIVEQRVNMTYNEPKAKPNSVIGLIALVLGDITSSGSAPGYKHRIIPVQHGVALPSIQVEHKNGGIQYKYNGVKGNSITLSGEAGGLVNLEANLMGSGARATSATTFAAAITESWIKLNQMKIWMESGVNIQVKPATLGQGTQNISSTTPSALDIRFKSFSFTYNNNLEPQPGAGGAGYLLDADFGRRNIELTFQLLFGSQTDLDLYINQTPVAIELDFKGAETSAASGIYYGFKLIFPNFKLAVPPLPQGGPGDILICDFTATVLSWKDTDDSNKDKPVIFEGYNKIAEYLTIAT